MLLKHLRRHLVTGRPIIHIRKEGLNISKAGSIIFCPRDNERMQLVLVKEFVREIRKKQTDIFPLRQFFCKLSEFRRPDTDKRYRFRAGNQFTLKIPVFYILQLKKLFSDLFNDLLCFRHRTSP